MSLTLIKRPGFTPLPLPRQEPDHDALTRSLTCSTHELALLRMLLARESTRLKRLFGDRLADTSVVLRDVQRMDRLTAAIDIEIRA